LSPFDFNFTNNFGWQTSVDGGMAVGKFFELSTGIRLEKVTVNSGHNSDIVYSSANEINANAENDYSATLATPYGLSPAAFVLNRTSDIGAASVDLKVDFHSEHHITNIQIPVGIRFYPVGKRNRMTIFAEAGASVNFLNKISNRIASIDTHHSAIKFTEAGTEFTAPDIRKEFYDLRLGGGLNYRFSKNMNFNFSYNFSRGLNPVFEQQNYKTVIDRQHISLGIRKSF
jgi:opacity protein-like surface antigen